MTAVFADTSYFIAFLCRDDGFHHASVELTRTLRDRIVTTYWVIAELGNFMCKGSDRAKFTNLLAVLRTTPTVEILSADDRSFDAGLELYIRRADKEWSIVDCISFATMNRLGITSALTADHHFLQAGFTSPLLESSR